MHSRTVIAVLSTAALLVVALTPATSAKPAANSDRPQVVEQRVTFTVVNTNTSGLPCPSDGATYEVRGLLTGPRSAFRAGVSRTISVYLHGFSFGGGWLWSFKDVPGYDWPTEMARLGHVSLSIDRLGYENSDHPEGQMTCVGSAADVTHQIVQSLRNRTYTVDGGSPVDFSKVILVGHDVGGVVAEVEAYSYDDIDGLVVWGWAEQGSSDWVMQRFPERTAHCLTGGESAEDTEPRGPTGYFHWPVTAQEVRDGIHRYMDPRVLDAAVPRRNRNPCGDIYSAFEATEVHANTDALAAIDIPVLLVYSDDDLIYETEGAKQQPAHFTGTDDLSWVMLLEAGHFPMLERRAGEYRQLVSNWLRARW